MSYLGYADDTVKLFCKVGAESEKKSFAEF